jgi:CHAT domain-containing protein
MKRAFIAATLLALAACRAATPNPSDLIASARSALREGRLADADELASRGIALTSATPDSTQAWAFRLLRDEVRISRNEWPEARRDLSAPLPASRAFDALRARQQYLLARATLADGNLRAALDLADRARGPARGEDALDLDDLRGQLRLRLGRWTDGESILRGVADAAMEAGDEYHAALALNDLGMGEVVRNRYDAAIAWFEQVLALKHVQSLALYPRAEYNAGIGYARLGQFDRAAALQREAVAAFAVQGSDRDREHALGQLGTTLLQQGSTEQGLQDLGRAFDVASAAHLDDDAAIWAGNLASANIDLQNWDEARRYNDEARRIKRLRQSGDLVHNNLKDAAIALGRGQTAQAERLFADVLGGTPPPDVRWEAQAGLARAALADGRRARASRYFQATLDTIESTRSDLLKSDYKVSFLSRLIQFYQAYVDDLVADQAIGRALEVADSSRGRVLAEGQGVAAPPRTTAASIQRIAARSGAALLSYWLAPSQSYLWVVTGRGVTLHRLPAASEIEPLVRAHQAAIASAFGDPLAGGDTAGDQLYRILVEPAAPAIGPDSTVVVVPDGALYGLNFETLPVSGPRRHYWIEDVNVEIAPSLSLLGADAAPPGGAPSLLAVGDAVPRPPDFPALSYAPAEMRAVASHFGTDRVTALEHGSASPAAYEAAHPDRFTFVHFAAHATANVESPLDSAIILSGPDNGYKLYARDVADESLRAELVTVSACRSAGEKAYAGEGLIGFAWAFLRAGARRVIAGLWDVDDRSTATLMDRLYAGIAAGETPSRALRAAKLDLLRQGGAQAKPYYWAPFELFTITVT